MDISIEQEVRGAVACVLKKSIQEIDSAASFDQLGADELDMFELIIRFEDTFMLEISDDDAAKLTSVESVVAYIMQCRNNANMSAA